MKLVLDWQVVSEEDVPLGWIRATPDNEVVFIAEISDINGGLTSDELSEILSLMKEMAPSASVASNERRKDDVPKR